MAACARCGARLADETAPCGRCGTPPEKALGQTLLLGSPAVPSPRADTLVLGSGVPLEEPQPEPEAAAAAPAAKPPLTPPLPPAPAARPERPKAPRRPAAERPPPPKPTPSPEALPNRPPPSRAGTPPRRRSVRIAAAAGTVALALVVLAAAVVASRRHASLTARVLVDPKGQPLLELGCDDCPNGTEVRQGSEAGSFDGGKATLLLSAPLSLGATRVGVEVRRPGAARFESRELPLEVDWIVSRDLSGLSLEKPELGLVFETRPGVSVVVDGNALPANAAGTRRYHSEITRDVTGTAAGVERLTRTIPYGVRLADGTLTRSSFELSVEVAPLSIDAPIESIVVEGPSFMLAGSTQPEGTVTVGGRPITVDPAGHFAQLMSVSAVGDTTITVRASAPGKAPRLAPIRIRRVASLQAEGERFAASAATSYSAIVDGVEQKSGWAVALTGTIREVEPKGHAARVLLEVEQGCSERPCLVQLDLGARCTFSAGDGVRAYGYLAGKRQDASTGRALPRVRVEFLRGES